MEARAGAREREIQLWRGGVGGEHGRLPKLWEGQHRSLCPGRRSLGAVRSHGPGRVTAGLRAQAAGERHFGATSPVIGGIGWALAGGGRLGPAVQAAQALLDGTGGCGAGRG